MNETMQIHAYMNLTDAVWFNNLFDDDFQVDLTDFMSDFEHENPPR